MLFNIGIINVLPNMIVILIISLIMSVICLEPNNGINDDIKTIIGKYLNKIPDIKPRYVLDDKLSKVINHFFKGKISTFPLYKVSLKIDRNPVKIPWTYDAADEAQDKTETQRAVDQSAEQEDDKNMKHYKVVKTSNHDDLSPSGKSYKKSNAMTASHVTVVSKVTPSTTLP